MRAMTGQWSQARLIMEAHADDRLQCLWWCMEVGILNNSATCGRHRRPRTLRLKDEGYAWWCSRCRSGESATVGSILYGCKLPPGKVLMLAYCYAHLMTYEATVRACNFGGDDPEKSHRTVAHWFGIFRDRILAHAEELEQATHRIGGPGVTVQVDEAQIGRRKYNKGRVGRDDTWVIGMIDEDGELRLEICEEKNSATLIPIIQRHVREGSEIHTDGWLAYRSLPRYGYTHKWVNHKERFVEDDGTHTQRIESAWRALRRRFTRGGLRHENIGDHLVEYLWRRKCRREGLDPMAELVKLLKSQ